MRQKYLILGLAASIALAGSSSVLALADTTNIGDAWKGSAIGEAGAQEFGLETALGWIYPSVGATVVYDDNTYNSEDNRQSATSLFVTLPRLHLELDGDAGQLIRLSGQLTYDADFLNSGSRDLGAALAADAVVAPTEKLELKAGAGWEQNWEKRGEGVAEGPAAELFDKNIRYQETSLRVGGSYGADEERSPRLNFDAVRRDRSYKNFRELNRGRDSVVDQVGVSLLYWVQPNTAMTASVRFSEYDYTDSDYDSTQWRYLLGAQWDLTYQTQGYIQLGRGEKYMKSSKFENAADYNWEVGVRWRPLNYSNFVLSTSRDFVEEAGFGWSDKSEYRAAWIHEWDTHLRSGVIFNLGDQSYSSSIREDDYWDLALRLHYAFRPWLNFTGSYQYSDRDSNLAGYSYDKNVYSLGFEMSFF